MAPFGVSLGINCKKIVKITKKRGMVNYWLTFYCLLVNYRVLYL